MDQLPIPSQSNPYSGLASQAMDSYNQANSSLGQIPGLQQNIANQTQQAGQFSAQMSPQQQGYPSFSNPYGLGSQNPLSQDKAQQNPNDSGNRGYTPYSLIGEANYR